ncbi:MAG: BON domain-containing protein [Pseudomonadota bacterium]
MISQDEEICRRVLLALNADSSVENTGLSVQVDQGVLTLGGIASSWTARLAAERASHGVAGVLDVANEIEVNVARGPAPDDANIARAVRNALEWKVLVPDSRIHSTVTHGHVRLTGDVDYWSEREDAARTIRDIVGVREVVNEIAIKPTHPASHEVKKAIEDALLRYAAQEANRLRLEVHGGKVTLFGAVSSPDQWQLVLHVARTTPGVRVVDDHLVVEQRY